MNLSAVVSELIREKRLDAELVSSIICDGVLTAYRRKYPDLVLEAKYNKAEDSVEVFVEKAVVTGAGSTDTEIGLKKARVYCKDAEVGARVLVPFSEPVGRIDIAHAKQYIATQILQAEATAIYKAFGDKVGTLVYGTVYQCKRGGVSVKLQDAFAFLPNSLSVPGERCRVGSVVRAILKEVIQEPREGGQLILDRATPLFVQRLFESEIPEVFDGVVELRSVARIAGYKTKVAVLSNDANVDAVGTCVGIGGSRISAILKEIGGEKIDVIPWSESQEDLIRSAMKPAEVNRVEIGEDGRAKLWLDEDQRSLAIGRGGQNIALASRLTGIDIDIVQDASRGDRDRGLVEAFREGQEDEDK